MVLVLYIRGCNRVVNKNLNEMSKSAVTPLHQALRKSFQNLQNNQKVWTSVLSECSPLMESLGNLAEQCRALSSVQICNTPLGVFPDLEERLRFKLLQATDTVLGKLNAKMASLQSVRDAISNQVSAVFQLYEQNTDSLDLFTVSERSATAPSVADMLEWLQDAERHYRQQFLRRKALLQTLRPDNLSLLESAPNRWKALESPSAKDNITGTQLHKRMAQHRWSNTSGPESAVYLHLKDKRQTEVEALGITSRQLILVSLQPFPGRSDLIRTSIRLDTPKDPRYGGRRLIRDALCKVSFFMENQ